MLNIWLIYLLDIDLWIELINTLQIILSWNKLRNMHVHTYVCVDVLYMFLTSAAVAQTQTCDLVQ